MKKTQKIKLDIHDAQFDFELLGIVSSENDYTLTWAINQTLEITLKKDTQLEITDIKLNVNKKFERFSYFDANTEISYTLISNKTENGYLAKEQSPIDFFLKLKSPTLEIASIVQRKIKLCKEIQAVFVLNPSELKSKKLFIFE